MKIKKLIFIAGFALVLLLSPLSREDAQAQTGWATTSSGSKIYLDDGKKLTGWQNIDGSLRYFRDSGTMVDGWQYIDGFWRYFRDSGTMVTSSWEWLPVEGQKGVYNWKFFNWEGKSINQFFTQSDGRKWLSKAGPDTTYHKGAWVNPENGFEYFFRTNSGSMVHGWQYIDGDWSYFRDSGTMVDGWQWLLLQGSNGEYNWKYFNQNGDSTDKLYEEKGNYWLSQSKPSESYVRGYWEKKDNGDVYYFRESTGTMVTGWQYIDGKWEFFKDSGVLVETVEELIKLGESPRNTPKSESSSSPKKYTLRDLKFHGVINWGGYKFTYYSQSVLPGGGLKIPGRHVSADGYVSDGDGYIVLANNAPKGTIIDTPFGAKGKVYDRGTYGNHFDVYTK